MYGKNIKILKMTTSNLDHSFPRKNICKTILRLLHELKSIQTRANICGCILNIYIYICKTRLAMLMLFPAR